MHSDDAIMPPFPEPEPKRKPARRRDKDDPAYGVNDRGEGRAPAIRYHRPEVADHVARMLIAHNFDYEAAVSKMLEADFPELPDTTIVRIANTLKDAPQVQKAVQARLKLIGIDDDAEKLYVSLLWNAALDKRVNNARWPAAMKLLGEMIAVQKKGGGGDAQSLRIEGAAEGLAKMGLVPSNTIPDAILGLEAGDAESTEEEEFEESEQIPDAGPGGTDRGASNGPRKRSGKRGTGGRSAKGKKK